MSYKPNICKKCGGRKLLIEPTCGFGWGFMLDNNLPEDKICTCNATVITRFPKEKENDYMD